MLGELYSGGNFMLGELYSGGTLCWGNFFQGELYSGGNFMCQPFFQISGHGNPYDNTKPQFIPDYSSCIRLASVAVAVIQAIGRLEFEDGLRMGILLEDC